MTNIRRFLIFGALLIFALLLFAGIVVFWPRETPVKFANVSDTQLRNLEVEFLGKLVRFETIEPHSTVVRSIRLGRVARADGVPKPCPIVRSTFGDEEVLLFGIGESPFKIPVQELSFQLDDTLGTPRIHVEAIDRKPIGYRYTSFHMKPYAGPREHAR